MQFSTGVENLFYGYSDLDFAFSDVMTNQIPDLLYPTIPYNTLQYLQYLHYRIVITNTVIRLVTQRPETVASEVK